MIEPLISVIVPVYNVEQYLDRCIKSIQNQTYKNLEIILVDDGSSDRGPEICDNYMREDNRIKVEHKRNGGLSDARNVGIDISKGEYLIFIDSDDYIKSDMIESLFIRIQKDKSEIAICNIEMVDENDNIISSELNKIKDDIWDEDTFWKNYYSSICTYCVVAWNKLYKRNLFEKERYDYGKTHEDEFIIHRIIGQCKKISCLSEKYYYYVQRNNSITHQGFSKKRMDVIEAYIERSIYFSNKLKKQALERTLLNTIEYFYLAEEKLDKSIYENKIRYKELKKKFKKSYFNISKNNSVLRFKFKLNLLIFIFLGTKVYRYTANIKKSVYKFIRG